ILSKIKLEEHLRLIIDFRTKVGSTIGSIRLEAAFGGQYHGQTSLPLHPANTIETIDVLSIHFAILSAQWVKAHVRVPDCSEKRRRFGSLSQGQDAVLPPWCLSSVRACPCVAVLGFQAERCPG
ncbi:hypothetical protein As57867_007972, partial [Aphanomyces stellatus]